MNPFAMAAEGDSSGTDTDPITAITDFAHKVGIHLPSWVLTVCTGLVALAALVTLCRPLLPGLRWLGHNIRLLCQRPRGPAAQRRRHRRRFAEHLANELRHLALQEEWRDDRYAELEAEVEIVQGQRWSWLPWRTSTRTPELELVSSLSTALQRSRDRRILLEGEPGAGKSVALRHVAWLLARWAAEHGDENTVVPIYLNLKDFRASGAKVTAQHVHDFVIETLNRANSRDVENFLDEEFAQGMDKGTWLFLFDSFDEIPAILGAADNGPIIAQYTEAILSFLGPLNECRAVIASREFHAPRSAGLTRFRIVRLTAKQQRQLVRKADLPGGVERAVLEGLSVAGPELGAFVDNPMFLGLLCEHMRTGSAFPTSSHAVFEGYLGRRFLRDANRIERRFAFTPEFVRAGAEDIAFAMTAVPSLGLSPAIAELRSAVVGLDRIGPAQFDKLLQALDYIKLGRMDLRAGQDTSFSFAHRRFQEYFATCVVIRDFRRVAASTMLTNSRWRETAVTLLQTSPTAITRTIVGEAETLLRAMPSPDDADSFAWPPGCLHVLSILAAGLGRRPDSVSNDLRHMISTWLTAAWNTGQRLDRRRALAFALLATPEVGQCLLEDGFASGNELLVETAFRQASQVQQPSAAIQRSVRYTLIALIRKGKIFSDRVGTLAQVKRFPEHNHLLADLRMIQAVCVADLLVLILLCTVDLYGFGFGPLLASITIFAPYRIFGLYVISGLNGGSTPDRKNRFWLLRFSEAPADLRSADLIIAGLLAGLFAAIPYLLLFIGIIGGPVGLTVGLLVMIYASLLPIGVLIAVVLDENLPVAAWPLLPFVAIRAGWVRLPSVMTWSRRHSVELAVLTGKSLLSVVALAVGAGVGLAVAALVVIAALAAVTGTDGRLTQFVAVTVLLLLMVIQLPVLIRSGRSRSALRELANSLEPFTKANLLRALELATSELVVKELVRGLRRNPSRCTSDVFDALADIAATVERLNHDRDARSRHIVEVIPDLTPAQPVFGRWYRVMKYVTIPYNTFTVSSVTEETLNEIARLVEESNTHHQIGKAGAAPDRHGVVR